MGQIYDTHKNEVNFVDFIIKFSLITFLSYLFTYSLILTDNKFGYNVGIIFLILSIILFYIFIDKLISLFYITLNYFFKKFNIKISIVDERTQYNLLFIPSLLVGVSSLYLLSKSIYLNYLDLNTSEYMIDYRGIAINLNSKLLSITTISVILLLFTFLFIHLSKRNVNRFYLSTSIFLNLLLITGIIFLASKFISYIYWFLAFILSLLFGGTLVG